MNRRNRNCQRKALQKFNNLIRKLCCWNCFQIGHKRFQCPYPKQPSCSFCRKPSILSVDCGCKQSLEHFAKLNVETVPNYNENVIVPINQPNGVTEYQSDENLMIIIENKSSNEEGFQGNEDDFLEINAETDSL
ncbi:hypothetical protein ACFFRR_008763, partial [Megaselia abdita]